MRGPMIGAGLSLLALAAPVALSSAATDVVCTGVAPATVQHDLIVPEGATCIVPFASEGGHDVIVNEGATLDDRGAYIKHDIVADHPAGVHVNGGGHKGPGSVGHDV